MMIRDLKVGDTLYRFTLKKANWKVYGGIITKIESDRHSVRIGFDDGNNWCLHQYDYEIGSVTRGASIGLTVNDIELAKKMFIEHEQERIFTLQKEIEESKKKIKLIKESK